MVSMASTVVAFTLAPLSPCSTGRCAQAWIVLGQGGTPGQVGRVLGLVRVMHLKADDLAAPGVENEEQVEPASLYPGP